MVKKIFCIIALIIGITLIFSFTACPENNSCSHDWEWVITTQPTETANGEETETCRICQQETGAKRPIPAKPTVIASVAININEPVGGGIPGTTISTTDTGYTSSVSWTPGDSIFLVGRAYTVNVSLTANSGYTFTGLNSATINGRNVTPSNNTGTTVRLSYTFPMTSTKTVTGIAIKSQPTKLTYIHTDSLDLAGLAVTLTYSDASTEDVSADNFAAKNITANPVHGSQLIRPTHNGQPITITCGSFTPLTTDNLTVNPKVITFNIDAIPAQVYNGSAHSPTVTVRDGSTILALNTDYTVGYANNISAGTASVTITGAANYAGSTGSGTFTITPALITSAEINITAPFKGAAPAATASVSGNFTVSSVSWSPTDNPFLGGVVYTVTVSLTANSGYTFASVLSSRTINGQTALVSNNTGAAVTLSYTFPKTDTRTIMGIAIKSQPASLTYTHGNTLNLTGLAVTLTFDDDSTEDVAAVNFAARNITTNPAQGNSLVHVTHNSKPVTITCGSLTPLTTGNLTVNPKVITFNIDTIPVQTYNGSAFTPTVTVRDGSTTLALNTDYIVAYSNNTNAGTATVTITGAANYAGSTGSGTFTINPKVITFNIDTIPEQTYTGSALTPAVIVRDGLTILTLNTDYTVAYINNINAGTATVNITGAGNYAGSARTGTFIINLKDSTFNIDTIPEQTYTGSAITPTVTVRDDSTILTLNTHYTVAYGNNINAGTATVTITGVGNYAGSTGSTTFTILQTVSPGRFEYYWVNEHGSLVTTSGGVVSIASGATLTITAQSSGYVVKQWHLNGKNTEQSGNTYTFSSYAAGKHTVGLFVEKDGKVYNTNITITITVE